MAAERGVERARKKQPLIAIGETQAARAPMGEAFDAPRGGARVVENETEGRGPRGVLWCGHERPRGLCPTRLQHRVGMEEQEPVAPCRPPPFGQLRAAPAWRQNESRASGLGDPRGTIG